MGARIDQLVKKPEFAIDRSQVQPSLPAGCYPGTYGPLASLTLQIASMGLDNHGKKQRSQPVEKGQNHSTVVEDPPLPSR